MAVRATPVRKRRQVERAYHPDWETDPLLRQYVSLPPPSSGKNDAVIRGLDGGYYPIWAIMLDYRATKRTMARLEQIYRGALTREQLEAALRFTELYPDEILPYVEELERAD